MNPILNLIHQCKKKSKLNLLIFPYDGIYEDCLPNHTLYVVPQISLKEWKPKQKRYFYLDIVGDNLLIRPNLLVDCVIVNDRYKQLEIAQEIAFLYKTPIVLVEHYKPKTKYVGMTCKIDIPTIYCNEEIRQCWQDPSNSTTIQYPVKNVDKFQQQFNEFLREEIVSYETNDCA